MIRAVRFLVVMSLLALSVWVGGGTCREPNDRPRTPLDVDISALGSWQKEVWQRIDVYACFVSGDRLEDDPLFSSLAPKPADTDPQPAELRQTPPLPGSGSVPMVRDHRREIYLLTLCRPRVNPGKRILTATASVRTIGLDECSFPMIPCGFLMNGQTYSVTKVLDADAMFSDQARETLLRSAPRIRITAAVMK
jgi:hypothetical protein